MKWKKAKGQVGIPGVRLSEKSPRDCHRSVRTVLNSGHLMEHLDSWGKGLGICIA